MSTTKKVAAAPKKFSSDDELHWNGWREVFFVGTEWTTYADINKVTWNFDHLEEALDEGELKDSQVYLFGSTEPQLIKLSNDSTTETVVPIPHIVAVKTDFPLPSTIGINSVTRGHEEIVDMSTMKMAWVPLEGNVDGLRLAPGRVHILKCVQRRAAVKQLKEERSKQFEYCLPYIFNPEKKVDNDESTEVHIVATINDVPYPMDYDWEMDDIEDFVKEFVENNELEEADSEKLKDIIKDEVRAAKLKIKEGRLAKQAVIDAMPQKQRDAFKSMKVLKFYPMNKTPNFEHYKTPYINRYFGKADVVV